MASWIAEITKGPSINYYVVSVGGRGGGGGSKIADFT